MPRESLARRPISVAYVEHNARLGGSVFSLHGLLKGLQGRVKPVVFQFSNVEFGGFFEDIGVETLTVPFEAFDYRKPNPYASLGRLGVELSVFRKYATYTLPLVAIFYAMFRRQRATLIHLNNHVYSHRSEIIAARLAGIPCVCHLREVIDRIHPLELKTSRFVSRFIAVSQSVKDAAVRGGLPGDRIDVVYNGIDFPGAAASPSAKMEMKRKLRLASDCTAVVSVGRLEPIRGTERIVQIWPEVVRTHPESRLLIVGDGTERSRLESMVDAVGVGDTVEFVGFQDNVWDYLEAGDVYVSNVSVPEAFGRALVEAMGMGLAVVAPDWGSTRELIEHGVSGLTYEPLDSNAMKDALIEVLSDAALRRRLAEQGANRARDRFGMVQYVNGVWEVYRDVLGERFATD